MALKHTLIAGVAALSLLVAPVGLTVQWNEHGPKLAAEPAIPSAFAAANRPNPKKPPMSGTPTFTSNGNASKPEGWQTGTGNLSDDQCQAVAETISQFLDNAMEATDPETSTYWVIRAETNADLGMDQGCAFANTGIA